MLVRQCEAAAMGTASNLRLGLLYRLLRAGELLALLAFVSWSSSHVPSAVAAGIRLAGSLLLNARFVFVLGNAIVLLLFALSRHDDLSSASSSNDQQQQPAASSTTTTATTTAALAAPQHHQQPVDDSVASFPSFSTPTTTPPPPVATPSADPLPYSAATASRDQQARDVPTTAPDPDPSLVLRRATASAFEDKMLQHQPSARVTKARAPRRSRSEKMASRVVTRRAASPELRRCESENGRRRRSSVTARDAEACWGREDADEFRRQVEAFIARQTRFHREESLSVSLSMSGGGQHCEAAPAFTGALAVVE